MTTIYQEVYKAISDALGGEPMEVHLEDVLRAIENKGLNDQAQYHDILQKLLVSNKRFYNLSLPFSEQSEEVYIFLKKILCI